MRAGTEQKVLQPTAALREEARQAAKTGLALQPNLGEAHWAQGYYDYACLKDYDAAERHFEQARQLLPNSSRIPRIVGLCNTPARPMGPERVVFQRSRAYSIRAKWISSTSMRFCISPLRRFPEALRKLDQVLNITPDDLDTVAHKAGYRSSRRRSTTRPVTYLLHSHPNADNVTALETQIYQAILQCWPGTGHLSTHGATG